MAGEARSRSRPVGRPLAARRAQPVERGTGGDDGVQIVGAVLLATSVAGATMGTDPGSPRAGRSSRPHPPGRSGQGGRHGPYQPAQQSTAADGERELQPRLGAITVPTLVCVGRHDSQSPWPANAAIAAACRTAAWRSSTDPAIRGRARALRRRRGAFLLGRPNSTSPGTGASAG